jgi:nucleolar pre-ribosomal-associated protein 2
MIANIFLQASNSRTAQEKLSALGKANAPFEHQLHEAMKFIGIEICQLGIGLEHATHKSERLKEVVYHGREEWLLRWLLKKMQVPEDDVPR